MAEDHKKPPMAVEQRRYQIYFIVFYQYLNIFIFRVFYYTSHRGQIFDISTKLLLLLTFVYPTEDKK
jgi:hypothetical protein